jgi:hypothetical protein
VRVHGDLLRSEFAKEFYTHFVIRKGRPAEKVAALMLGVFDVHMSSVEESKIHVQSSHVFFIL